ncbi:MAG: Flp1 family type IVb pilin [Firmicutes bacterium]|nr:Flp1 family type IVb pilin [Bacillota bacterium]
MVLPARIQLWFGNGLEKCVKMMEEERGEVNMVAIVLIILVVIALIAIFRDNLTQLLGSLFEKIEQEALNI